MSIPLKYNLRSVRRRWKTTAMTILAIGLVVAVFISILAMANGLAQAFAATGHPANVLLLREGATAETNSTVERADFTVAQYLPGIATDAEGNALASLESLNLAIMNKQGGGSSNATVRGINAYSLAVRGGVRVVEGRMPSPGLNELIVGNGAAARFESVKVGDRIKLVKSEWTIVGRFDAGRTAYASEFWGDADQLNREFDRTAFSSILLRAASERAADALIESVETSQRLANLGARRETAYYAEQTKASAPLQFLGYMISIIMAVGAVFAAMNAMYASVSARSWEIATLRVLGFTRGSVLLAFTLESLVIGAAGGIVGCVLAWPINGYSIGTTSFTTFSEIAFAFTITPKLMATGVLFASVIGVVGGFLPALQASRIPIIDGLKRGS